MKDEIKDEILKKIKEICWNTINLWYAREKKEKIIHFFTNEVIDYLNNYCTKKEPTSK